MKYNNSEKLYNRGVKTLVGAVNSPVRAFKSVGGTPLFIDRAEGAYIYDVDGNKYIDLVQSYGPMILGHGHPSVLSAVKDAIQDGFSYGASTEKEIELAEMVCGAFLHMDKVRFVNSGTEAVMSAIRLARAVTGRSKIVKFSGCYHGHSDSLLVAAGSGVETLAIPSSKGVPSEAIGDTLIATYNDIHSVQELVDKHDDIAAVIIEPIAGNMGVVLPNDHFLEELRTLTKDNGILFVVDEVMTGFRSTFGGVQEKLDIEADITCLGKIVGGGFPVGAFGASAEIMDNVAPVGDVYQAGTLSGNPVSMAAGIATLKELSKDGVYDQLNTTTEKIQDMLIQAAKDYEIDICVNRFGSMVSPFFTSASVIDFKSAKTTDQELFSKFFWSMLEQGVYLPPSPYESWFISTAIGDEELKVMERAIHESMKSVLSYS